MKIPREGWDRDGCSYCLKDFRKNENWAASFVCNKGHAFHFDCYCLGWELGSIIEQQRKRIDAKSTLCPLCRGEVFYGDYSSYKYLPTVGLQFLHPYKLPPPPPPPPPAANPNPNSSSSAYSSSTVLRQHRPQSLYGPPMVYINNDSFCNRIATTLGVLGVVFVMILLRQWA